LLTVSSFKGSWCPSREPIPPDNGVPLSAHELPVKRSLRGRSSRDAVRDTRQFNYAPSNLRQN
jgi:hypothetical protein